MREISFIVGSQTIALPCRRAGSFAVLQHVAQHGQGRASHRYEQQAAPREKIDRQQHHDDVKHRHRHAERRERVDREDADG